MTKCHLLLTKFVIPSNGPALVTAIIDITSRVFLCVLMCVFYAVLLYKKRGK
jgi:hypothetical protein